MLDEPRPGRPRKIGDDEIAAIIQLTLETTPPGATHWSLRSMAKAVGYAPSTIRRIWRAFGLQPHRTETFKLSNDPLFVEKVRDIVGLYKAPPDRALVLCVDEKSQIQALDRSQPLTANAREQLKWFSCASSGPLDRAGCCHPSLLAICGLTASSQPGTLYLRERPSRRNPQAARIASFGTSQECATATQQWL